ncbi:MAG: hypothetical protein PHQ74_05100 [Crocinitomicaceae bacterium]|nr:hypothetical protein [Crocinitomicaceae bacterium]
MKILFYALILMTLSSCIEIVDDLSINNDGSGTAKYTINLSSSKIKANSYLALDSLNGKKVPSISDIEKKIEEYKKKLENKEGISNVVFETNFTDFIFKFQCDFESVQNLQKAVKEIVASENKNLVDDEYVWLSWKDDEFSRSLPALSNDLTAKMKSDEVELLKNGSFISITRFDRPIEKQSNANAKISANRLAVMIRTNPYLLTQNTEILKNTIYLSPIKKQVKN